MLDELWEGCVSPSPDVDAVAFFDRIFLLGEVNSYITQPGGTALAYDQLSMSRKQDGILCGFQEHDVSFSPTFTPSQGASTATATELPSYTSRILFKSSSLSSLRCLNYSKSELRMAPSQDHLPVYATFGVQILRPCATCFCKPLRTTSRPAPPESAPSSQPGISHPLIPAPSFCGALEWGAPVIIFEQITFHLDAQLPAKKPVLQIIADFAEPISELLSPVKPPPHLVWEVTTIPSLCATGHVLEVLECSKIIFCLEGCGRKKRTAPRSCRGCHVPRRMPTRSNNESYKSRRANQNFRYCIEWAASWNCGSDLQNTSELKRAFRKNFPFPFVAVEIDSTHIFFPHPHFCTSNSHGSVPSRGGEESKIKRARIWTRRESGSRTSRRSHSTRNRSRCGTQSRRG